MVLRFLSSCSFKILFINSEVTSPFSSSLLVLEQENNFYVEVIKKSVDSLTTAFLIPESRQVD